MGSSQVLIFLSLLLRSDCKKLTDVSVLAIAQTCDNLLSLNLSFCGNITDASVLAIAQKCRNLIALLLG